MILLNHHFTTWRPLTNTTVHVTRESRHFSLSTDYQRANNPHCNVAEPAAPSAQHNRVGNYCWAANMAWLRGLVTRQQLRLQLYISNSYRTYKIVKTKFPIAFLNTRNTKNKGKHLVQETPKHNPTKTTTQPIRWHT